jgi:hypothetical protein
MDRLSLFALDSDGGATPASRWFAAVAGSMRWHSRPKENSHSAPVIAFTTAHRLSAVTLRGAGSVMRQPTTGPLVAKKKRSAEPDAHAAAKTLAAERGGG